MKNIIYKILPYITSIVAAIVFYIIAGKYDNNVNTVLLNISSALFVIPILYFIYEATKSISERKLNKEILDYAKMQIDSEILSMIKQVSKILIENKDKNFFQRTNDIIKLKLNEIKDTIKDRVYLGFTIMKRWGHSELYFKDILKNSYILKNIKNDQVIVLIKIIKCIRRAEEIFRFKNNLFINTGNRGEGYKLATGQGVYDSEVKNEYTPRYILLKKIGDDEFSVEDFGDFEGQKEYNEDKLLAFYKINSEYLDFFAELMLDLLTEIKNWIKLSGNEIIIDTKQFKIIAK